jgi:acyl carrier protein
MVAEVSALMRDILDFDQVAPDDNFFDVGGTSVMALTLIAEVAKRYGVRLRLIDVIGNATPVALAELIGRDGPAESAVTEKEPAETGRS